MTVINGKTLTTFEVAQDGSTVSINVADHDSKPASLVLPAECLRALVMTLPKMVRQSLQRRYRDPSLRLVYPMLDWRLEASSEADRLILTLSTGDGFDVSFALEARDLQRMAQCSESGARSEAARAARLPN